MQNLQHTPDPFPLPSCSPTTYVAGGPSLLETSCVTAATPTPPADLLHHPHVLIPSSATPHPRMTLTPWPVAQRCHSTTSMACRSTHLRPQRTPRAPRQTLDLRLAAMHCRCCLIVPLLWIHVAKQGQPTDIRGPGASQG